MDVENPLGTVKLKDITGRLGIFPTKIPLVLSMITTVHAASNAQLPY